MNKTLNVRIYLHITCMNIINSILEFKHCLCIYAMFSLSFIVYD